MCVDSKTAEPEPEARARLDKLKSVHTQLGRHEGQAGNRMRTIYNDSNPWNMNGEREPDDAQSVWVH